MREINRPADCKHKSRYGLNKHKAKGEVPCQACWDADVAYKTHYYKTVTKPRRNTQRSLASR